MIGTTPTPSSEEMKRLQIVENPPKESPKELTKMRSNERPAITASALRIAKEKTKAKGERKETTPLLGFETV
uniref:Uncharacterized protein n=1 Tax=Steinernema glaseri TaxID=37863 RepID=A0A1I7YC65_9BILA